MSLKHYTDQANSARKMQEHAVWFLIVSTWEIGALFTSLFKVENQDQNCNLVISDKRFVFDHS